jgi:5-formyltetrahydrofolate cyclo-ligase
MTYIELTVPSASIATRNLLSLPEYQAAKTLSVYLSMPSGEIMTAAVVRDAFSKGKQVYVPYIHAIVDSSTGKRKSSIMDMLALHSLEDYESLQPDKWGIPSLDATTVSERKNCLGGQGVDGPQAQKREGLGLDFIVMPGMAFDESFARLGHGKGYYDHFLNRYQAIMGDSSRSRKPYLGASLLSPFDIPPPTLTDSALAALSLKEQFLSPPDKVPMAEHDWPVDALVIGDGRIMTREI